MYDSSGFDDFELEFRPDNFDDLDLGIVEPIIDGTAVMLHDGKDVEDWQLAYEDNRKLQRTVKSVSGEFPTAQALARDLLWSFYMPAPVVKPIAPVKVSHQVNAKIMQATLQTEDWNEVRGAGTVGDLVSSTMATSGLLENVIHALDKETKEQVKQAMQQEQKAESLEKHAQDMQSQADAIQQAADKARQEAEQAGQAGQGQGSGAGAQGEDDQEQEQDGEQGEQAGNQDAGSEGGSEGQDGTDGDQAGDSAEGDQGQDGTGTGDSAEGDDEAGSEADSDATTHGDQPGNRDSDDGIHDDAGNDSGNGSDSDNNGEPGTSGSSYGSDSSGNADTGNSDATGYDSDTLQALADALQAKAEQMQEQAAIAGLEAEQARDELEQTAKTLAAKLAEQEPQIRQAARQSLDKAEAELEQATEAMQVFNPWYGHGGGNATRLQDAKLKQQIAERVKNNPQLQAIMDMVGRMQKVFAEKRQTKIDWMQDEITSVTTGDSIPRLVPGEFALLADQSTEDLFYKKYVEDQLQIFEYAGYDQAGRGPIIAALDSSLSMRGERNVWATGIAIMMVNRAIEESRDIAIIHFADKNDNTPEIKTFEFKANQPDPLKLLDAVTFMWNGGTSYKYWIQEATRLVAQAAYDKADVICISDGEADLDAETLASWNSLRKEREMHSYGVLIAEQYSGLSSRVLPEVCDEVAILKDIQQDSRAVEMMVANLG